MRESKLRGVLSTHLHEIVDSPHMPEGVRLLQMPASYRDDGTVDWKHAVQPGVCRESLALETARFCEVPEDIVDHARRILGVDEADRRLLTDAQDLFGSALDLLPRAWVSGERLAVPPGHDPPASATGSCLYLLRVRKRGAEKALPEWYVGETDALQERLEAHARDPERETLFAEAVRMRDKSAARRAETLLQRSLRGAGVRLWSDTDAQHVRF